MICFETDELPVLHPYVHRQGSGRGAARAAAAAARQRARRFPGGRDDTAAGEEDTFTIDRTPRRSLATAGTGGGLLLPFELEVTTVIAGTRAVSPSVCTRKLHGCTLNICTWIRESFLYDKNAHPGVPWFLDAQ